MKNQQVIKTSRAVIKMSDLICHIVNLTESKQKGFNSKNINKVRKKIRSESR